VRRIFVCAGAPRSGSTWQYNLVRLLAKEAYGSVYAAWIADYEPIDGATAHVVKIHDPKDAAGLPAGLAVTSNRDLRAVLASARRMQWAPYRATRDIRSFLDRYVRQLEFWSERAVHVMRYEQMMADPIAEAQRTAAALGIRMSRPRLDKICDAIAALEPPGDKPTGKFGDADPLTQLHPGHIGGGRGLLDEKSRLYVERRYETWLRGHGYVVPRPARQGKGRPAPKTKTR
jgi:Sulfotransferase domain